jgi:hypothetical protein
MWLTTNRQKNKYLNVLDEEGRVDKNSAVVLMMIPFLESIILGDFDRGRQRVGCLIAMRSDNKAVKFLKSWAVQHWTRRQPITNFMRGFAWSS